MVTWYIKTSREELGPFSGSEIRTKAELGELTRKSQIRRATDNSWIAAGRVTGLFPQVEPKTVESASVGITSVVAPIACVILVACLTLINAILVFLYSTPHEIQSTHVDENEEQIDQYLVRKLEDLTNQIDLGVTRIPLLCSLPVERILFSLDSVLVEFLPVAVEVNRP